MGFRELNRRGQDTWQDFQGLSSTEPIALTEPVGHRRGVGMEGQCLFSNRSQCRFKRLAGAGLA